MGAIRCGSAGLNVSDLARSKAFYEATLGFVTIRESNDPAHGWALLGREGTVLLTLWQQSCSAFATDRAGLHHLSFEVDSIAALEKVELAVRAAGVAVRDDPGVIGGAAATGQLFFVDPDGIRLEVYTEEEPTQPAPASPLPRCGFYPSR